MKLVFLKWTLLLVIATAVVATAKSVTLLNVSYDPTREFYKDYNKAFIEYWSQKTGQSVTVRQSHGGSGKQARSIIDGLKADVATLALAYDIDEIASKGKLLPANWQDKLLNHSTPYTSTIVFLVRKGNPKKIKDWNDLIKPGISVITPNPKTSGGARWNYLAAWGYAVQKELGGVKQFSTYDPLKKNDVIDGKAKKFVQQIFKNVPILDAGARGATNTFIQRGIGDVLIAWENEALLTLNEIKKGEFEIVLPSNSISAAPPVALIEKNASSNGTTEVALAYLKYMYEPKGQAIAAKHYFRPIHPEYANANDLKRFAKIDTYSIVDAFGSWQIAQKKHFSDGGTFDQIYLK